MKTWLLIQAVTALGYFALAALFFGTMAFVFLPAALIPLLIFYRLEYLATTNGILEQIDLRLLTAFLAWVGVLLVVIPYALTEIFWFAKEFFFQPGRSNLFWSLGWIAFVTIGVQFAWTATLNPWTKIKKRHNALLTLTRSFNSITNVPGRPIKIVSVAFVAVVIWLGFTTAIAAALVWLGGYSSAEVFDDPGLVLQYQLMTAGLLLTSVPAYGLACYSWQRDVLVNALTKGASS